MSNYIKYVNNIRSLGIQAIYNAKQGHPGMAISAAPITYSVYAHNINITNLNPNWINRDRFVLSGGHGSMSLYPILHFAGVLDINEIKNFRQENSLTPGHPESYLTPFIDATTGPLGQGVSIGVGMAIAEKYLRYQYADMPGLIDHYTYIVLGDGDLQEGISYESMSLAGKLNLNKLICLYDSNKYQLESSVELVNIENTQQRLESMGWYYQIVDNNPNSINEAINNAKNQNKPSFIEINTIIGEGLEQMNSYESHGCSINEDNLNKFFQYFNLNPTMWEFDNDTYKHFSENVFNRGNQKYLQWKQLIEKYKKLFPERINEFLKQTNNEFINFENLINLYSIPKNLASRSVVGWILKELEKHNIKDTIVLSPDLSKSTSVKFNDGNFNENTNSPTIFVGIREFAMGGIQNGICLHKGLRCYSSSFMSFVDYFKAAIRLGCISKINPVYFLTHDSVLIGSDGPTHQPIEQLGMLRLIPNHNVFRPCDEIEVFAAIQFANSQTTSSTSIVLSRQNLKSNYKTNFEKTIKNGGYKLINYPDSTICILATGSEVELAFNVHDSLKSDINSDVYSIPNLNLFLQQTKELEQFTKYKLIVVLEASNDNMWYQILKYNSNLLIKSINKYGKSMDGTKLYNNFGFNSEIIKKEILSIIKEK